MVNRVKKYFLIIILPLLIFSHGCDDKVSDVLPRSIFRSKKIIYQTLEAEVFSQINEIRKNNGAHLLENNESAVKIARAHSRDMARMRCLTHSGSDDLTVERRADRAAIDWQLIGENVARNKGYKSPSGKAVMEWMKSSGHRKNILNEKFTLTGIGIAKDESGYYYFTQVFVQPMP
jgi:uncharacterized protein YkwD